MEPKLEAEGGSPSVTMSAPSERDIFGGLTVGHLLGEGSVGCKLLLHYDLGDAASALAASGRTAAAVADSMGNVVGLLTENDMMRAFFEGAWPSHKLIDWMDSGMARAPNRVVQKVKVRPWTPLAEVAETMVSNAMAGTYACHHVMVQDEAGKLCGVLSSLDMLQALCRPEMWEDPQLHHMGKAGPMSAPMESTRNLAVSDVMKSRDDVFVCPPGDTLKDVVRVLLLTQQNSALVVDMRGIYGIVTPRDAVKAFADGVSNKVRVADWLASSHPNPANRIIESDATVVEAAAKITAKNLHHLIVVRPGTQEAVGTLSSLDLALSTFAQTPLLRSMSTWTGPTVGELVGKQWHLTAVCNKGTTLREAAELLVSSGRTSTALALSDDSAPLRLLTENDILRAYEYGWEPDRSAESWLVAKLIPRSSHPQHLMVPPSLRLTEAASLMLTAAKPGGDPCQHLVVKGVKGVEGGWLGVFSALDVARALSSISSELEVAKTGADKLPVSAVMRTLDDVPTCLPGETLRQAFNTLIATGQNAVLVVDETGTYSSSILTPRSALKALATDVPLDCTVAGLLVLLRPGMGETPREIPPHTRLLDAASIMTARCVHHLVVADPLRGPVGVLSSLDLVRAVASIRSTCPFTSLGWLRACKGPSTCRLW